MLSLILALTSISEIQIAYGNIEPNLIPTPLPVQEQKQETTNSSSERDFVLPELEKSETCAVLSIDILSNGGLVETKEISKFCGSTAQIKKFQQINIIPKVVIHKNQCVIVPFKFEFNGSIDDNNHSVSLCDPLGQNTEAQMENAARSVSIRTKFELD